MTHVSELITINVVSDGRGICDAHLDPYIDGPVIGYHWIEYPAGPDVDVSSVSCYKCRGHNAHGRRDQMVVGDTA